MQYLVVECFAVVAFCSSTRIDIRKYPSTSTEGWRYCTYFIPKNSQTIEQWIKDTLQRTIAAQTAPLAGRAVRIVVFMREFHAFYRSDQRYFPISNGSHLAQNYGMRTDETEGITIPSRMRQARSRLVFVLPPPIPHRKQISITCIQPSKPNHMGWFTIGNSYLVNTE